MTRSGGDALRDRLGELVRQRRAGVLRPLASTADSAVAPAADALSSARDDAALAAAPPAPARRKRATAASVRKKRTGSDDPAREGVEAYLPGGVWTHERHGSVYVHERLRSAVEKRKPQWGRLPEPSPGEIELSSVRHLGLSRALFLDLETCGLSSSPVFLAGTMFWNGEDFVLRQYFARHYGEEAALLAAVAEQVQQFELMITFNGKSYDAPFLHARALTHGVALQLPRHHLDLVHHSRRRWREELPDCRLTTLESRICKRRRTGDVPGEEIPERYHEYVRSGDPWPMVPVFHHNLLDVTTMADVLHALCKPRRVRVNED
ncbi:MAG: ribonuclease H-like domain-containing protein [Candidatus Eisenbacteria bacterium]|nr:ribonuclease H-like domain-containing protein [Candidatus Eisenbacteria bacterium]